MLGLVYGAAQLLQTVGLTTTSASVSGFITGLYVVLTPLLAAVLLRARLGGGCGPRWRSRRPGSPCCRCRAWRWAPARCSPCSAPSSTPCTWSGWVCGAAVRRRSGSRIVQLLTISVVCTVGALPGGITLPTTGADWTVLVYMAVIAGAVALLVQTWAQAHVSSTRAAITMTMEPVWAATFAVPVRRRGARLARRCSAVPWCSPRCTWSSSGRRSSPNLGSRTARSGLRHR